MATILFTQQPSNLTIAPSAAGTFTVAVSSSGQGISNYEWYVAQSTAPSSYTKIEGKDVQYTGENTATLTIEAGYAQVADGAPPSNGDLYKVKVKDKDKTEAYSDPATLSVVAPTQLEIAFALHGGRDNFLRLRNLGYF